MKKFFLAIWIVMLGVMLCGCVQKDNPAEIQFMTWGSSTEMGIITPLVNEYNNTHDIKVRLVHVPQNYFQKLHLLFASNLAPDVIFINNLYLKTYQRAGLLEDLSNIIDKNEYFENALETLSADGKIYAIPRDVSSMVIYYNKNLFKKSHINPNKNWDIDEFYEISKKLKTANDYGFCTEFEPGYVENFISVENKPLFLKNQLTLFEKSSVSALQKLADAINKQNLSPNKEQLTITPCAQLFLQKKSPMFVSGRWSLPKIKAQADFEFDILPFPYGKSKFYIPLNSSGWAISKNSKNKAASLDFVKYLSSDENIKKLTESNLITPAKKTITYSDSFVNGEVFIDIIEKSTPNIVPADYNITIDKVKIVFNSVLGGYKTAENALKNF